LIIRPNALNSLRKRRRLIVGAILILFVCLAPFVGIFTWYGFELPRNLVSYKSDLEMCDRCGDRRKVRWMFVVGFSTARTNRVGKTELHTLLFPDGSSCSNSHEYGCLGSSMFKYGTRDGFSRFSAGSPNGISLYEHPVLLRAMKSVVATNVEVARALFRQIDPLSPNDGQALATEIAAALQGNDSDALVKALQEQKKAYDEFIEEKKRKI
jgi:hypothetical protein